MLPRSFALNLLALSLDDVRPIALDIYDRMQRDWWATAYWGGVWICGFIATFLLIRMLFTHWGDRDVMKKTLGLSLIVHMLVGMLSTTVIFGPGASPEGEPQQQPLTIRRIVNEGASLNGEPARDAAGNFAGAAPAWDQPAKSATDTAARLERQTQSAPDAAAIKQPRPSADERIALSLPDLPERSEPDDPRPAPDRQTARLGSPAGATPAPIAEETAAARPESRAARPTDLRATRGTPEAPPAEVVRRVRPESVDVVRRVEKSPGVSESTTTSDPGPLVARSPENRSVPRPVRGSPRSEPIDDGAIEAPAAPGDAAAAPSPGRPNGRIGRPARGAGELDSPERTRPDEPGNRKRDRPFSVGSLSPGGPAAADGLDPARPFGGEPGGDGLVPSVRNDSEGAIGKNAGKVPATYRLRTSPERKKIALDMGANEESERAVETSLQWLADHQHARGHWEPIESTLGKEPDPAVDFGNPQERERSGFQSESGLTALAVLAFLGKGYTHEDNPFAENVDRALRWLISQQDSQGFLGGRANRYARMYCHGMAAIAIGEAYGMTKDQTLREPLMHAVQYIVDTQNADGGWRYFKGKHGDMSMFGWQLMALKSAKTAGLAVPQASMNRAIDFLIAQGDELKSRRLSQFGGLASYRIEERPKPSMTAEALFCKQMLGIKRTNRASVEAVEYLLKNLPQRSKQDLYYWYYGTLAMYHHGGEAWRRWNQALRDNLVADQRTDDDFAGSWNPRAPWGDYGGRVFSTALSTLCLEVYYRFLPLYQTEDAERLEQRAGK